MYWHFASSCIQTNYFSTCLVQDLVESYGLHNEDYIFIVNHYSLNLGAHTQVLFFTSVQAHLWLASYMPASRCRGRRDNKDTTSAFWEFSI